jgi:transposase, IS30 family
MQIQPNERDKIAILLTSGLSQRAIAKKLGRSSSTISDEISRNSVGDIYEPIRAQTKADRRKSKSGRRHPLKNASTYSYVLNKLRQGWSPEQISGRLQKERGVKIISYETIYRFIYSPEHKDKRLWEYLPKKQKKRRKKYGRKVSKVKIPNRVSIHLRDKTIETRKDFGHWEGDSIIGKQIKSKTIHTEVERKTRYLSARVIKSKSAKETVEAQKKIFSKLPAKTVTLDNGIEFVKHQELNQIGIKTYFADPYCSGQRGTNENTNGLIRRYLPKKTSFDNLTQEELDDIVWEINNRPRKTLHYLTPQEMLKSELTVIK